MSWDLISRGDVRVLGNKCPKTVTRSSEFWTLNNVLEDAVKNHRVREVPVEKKLNMG